MTVGDAPLVHQEVRLDTATRQLFLLRHAKSSWGASDISDYDRPLAPRGERAVEKLRGYMAQAGVAPALVLCSAAKRAHQTLAGVQGALGDGAEVSLEEDLYLLSAEGWINRLRRVPDTVSSVMAVGHNPGLQILALMLAGSGDATLLARMGMKYPSGGFAALSWPGAHWSAIGENACRLDAFVVPREL